MTDSRVFTLIDACCEAIDNPGFAPRNGMTFCNQAVCFVAERMGCTDFKSMMANQIVALMKKSSTWKQIPLASAQELANAGCLVIAGMKGAPHGHVAVIRPGVAGYSAKWKASAPKVINVGKENFIGRSLNWAFGKNVPDTFVWKGTQ